MNELVSKYKEQLSVVCEESLEAIVVSSIEAHVRV